MRVMAVAMPDQELGADGNSMRNPDKLAHV